MLKHIKFGLILAASAIIATAMVGESEALFGRKAKNKKPKKHSVAPETFSMSGRYAGRLAGGIKVSGKDIYVSENTLIYVIGEGFSRGSVFVTKSYPLYVGGMQKDGARVASFIIIKPSELRRSSLHRASAKDWKPSASDPSVGVFDEDADL